MKSYMAKKEEDNRGWALVDLKGQTLGRAATKIATILRGKHRPTFTPHVDTGDFVIAINAAHIKLTGNKAEGKIYYSHSGYMGGLKEISAGKLLEKHPGELISKAVWGMLPNNRSRKHYMTKLKVFAGAEHTHAAQQPQVIDLNA